MYAIDTHTSGNESFLSASVRNLTVNVIEHLRYSVSFSIELEPECRVIAENLVKQTGDIAIYEMVRLFEFVFRRENDLTPDVKIVQRKRGRAVQINNSLQYEHTFEKLERRYANTGVVVAEYDRPGQWIRSRVSGV